MATSRASTGSRADSIDRQRRAGPVARLLLPWLLLWSSPAAGQVPNADPKAQFERHLTTAREGPLQVRAQAAGRILALGDVAAAGLWERFGADLDALADQGQETVEVLGRFGDPRLTQLAWRAVDDLDFPWRPAALRGLARAPESSERERWLAALSDPLAAVRAAAVGGLERLAAGAAGEREPWVAALTPLLSDEDDRVRRAAAFALADLGRPQALHWPLLELSRGDRWFELENGRAARYDAARGLAARLGGLHGYRPELEPMAPENEVPLATLERLVREKEAAALGVPLEQVPRPELPAVAQLAPAMPPSAVGLELRSCRRGEFFLALGIDDTLRVGLGNPLVLPLPPGSTTALSKLLEDAYVNAGARRDFGRPGCDLEVYRRVPSAGAPPEHLRLLKGPDPVPGLRPDALRPFLAELLGLLPETAGDSRGADLRARLGDALAAVGGPL